MQATAGTGLLMVDAHLGTIGVWLAFVASIVGAAVMAFGLARPRRVAVRADGAGGGDTAVRAAGGRAAARPGACSSAHCWRSGAMEHALVTHDFALVFVAENNSTVTPLLYSITGLWSALAGSILLWGLVLSGRHRDLRVALPAPGARPGDPLGHARCSTSSRRSSSG